MNVLITGVLGNFGSLMTKYLMDTTDCSVYGVARRKSNLDFTPIQDYLNSPRFKIVYGDSTDDINLNDIFREILPDYVFNFAGFTQVGPSWECPAAVYDINLVGVMRFLEIIRKNKPSCRFLSCGSIEQYANSTDNPITLDSLPAPSNIYGGSKNAAFDLIKIYRQKYNLYAVQAILGNSEGRFKDHKSFAFNKVIHGVVRILKLYKENKPFKPIQLGNLDAMRAWGDTEDFCDGLWRMLNQEKYIQSPVQDYILSAREFHTVKDLVNYSCFNAGLPIEWRGTGLNEFAFIPPFETNRIIEVSPDFYRVESRRIDADSSKIKKELGWKPQNDFRGLVKKLITFELNK
jgi:GDPmannose 4,6-dehydratase